jgi:hypothetical protein
MPFHANTVAASSKFSGIRRMPFAIAIDFNAETINYPIEGAQLVLLSQCIATSDRSQQDRYTANGQK